MIEIIEWCTKIELTELIKHHKMHQ